MTSLSLVHRVCEARTNTEGTKVSILLLALKINLKESVISRLGDTHLTFHFCPVGDSRQLENISVSGRILAVRGKN